MEGFLFDAGIYEWVKAFHIIFVIFWMAGMFMMPRYLAYHCQCETGSDEDTKWIERERRLMRIIINPAMTITWILGLALVFNIGFGAGGWLHAKLFLVFILSGFHGVLSKHRRLFEKGERPKSEKYYRRINEVPALFIILVVILVIVRPF